MSDIPMASSAELENQAFPLLIRLHVILRRQINRVVDIEYMRIDPSYCQYVLDLAKPCNDAEAQQVRHKLEQLYFGQGGLFMRGGHTGGVGVTIPSSASTAGTKRSDPEGSADTTYVGRLR